MQNNLSNTVSIVRCSRYQKDTVLESIKYLLAPWGGIGYFVSPGQKVLLKPNLLAAVKPEEAVTTHPIVIKALAELVQEAGGLVYIGDSPGSNREASVYRLTGMQAVAEETNSNLIVFDRMKKKDYYIRSGKQELELAAVLDEVDTVINVAKLKTHPLTGLTAAVKNTYGCIVGKKKSRMHFEHPLPRDFARIVVEIYLAVKPALSIIDAIIAMEGAGPRRGKPKNSGLLLGSPNAVALDRIASECAGFKPDQVTTLTAAREKGLAGVNLNEITTKGLSLEESRIRGFNKGTAAGGNIGRLAANFPVTWLRGWLENRRPYPNIDDRLCTNCGQCAKWCPAQVISTGSSIPDIEIDSCIRCYCCGEFCPTGAVNIK